MIRHFLAHRPCRLPFAAVPGSCPFDWMLIEVTVVRRCRWVDELQGGRLHGRLETRNERIVVVVVAAVAVVAVAAAVAGPRASLRVVGRYFGSQGAPKQWVVACCRQDI